MKKFFAWGALIFGLLYFALPLIGMTNFSLKMRRGEYSFDAYGKVLTDPRFQETFSYSVVMALFTIVFGVLLVVPTAYWVRLKLPGLRPYIEFITLLPLVIPAIVIVFGYIRLYNTSSLASADRHDLRHQPAFDVRLCHARLALHVPRRRYWSENHRRLDADGSGAEPWRGVDDHSVAHHPAQCSGRRAIRCVFDLRHRHR